MANQQAEFEALLAQTLVPNTDVVKAVRHFSVCLSSCSRCLLPLRFAKLLRSLR